MICFGKPLNFTRFMLCNYSHEEGAGHAHIDSARSARHDVNPIFVFFPRMHLPYRSISFPREFSRKRYWLEFPHAAWLLLTSLGSFDSPSLPARSKKSQGPWRVPERAGSLGLAQDGRG